MSSRGSKKRGSSKQAPRPIAAGERPAAHYEVSGVLGASLHLITTLFNDISQSADGLQKRCALIADRHDRLGLGFYERLAGPMPAITGRLVTLEAPFRTFLDAGAESYRIARHAEPALLPGQLRAIVLTLGAFTVFHLERDETPVGWNPVYASDSYIAKHGDVLLVAIAAFRRDKSDGFAFKRVFRTREEGETFFAYNERHMVAIGRTPAPMEAAREELEDVRHTYPANLSLEEFARVHALVSWLQGVGELPYDVNNGAERVFGCELELQGAGELSRELGEPLDTLN